MRLAFKGTALPLWQEACHCICRCVHKWKACTTVNHEGGNLDGSDPLGRQHIVTHNGSIVGERVCKSFLRMPPGCLARLGDEFRCQAHHLCHKKLDRISSTTRRDQFGGGFRRVCRRVWRAFVNKVRCLAQRKLGDLVRKLACRFKGKCCSGGHTDTRKSIPAAVTRHQYLPLRVRQHTAAYRHCRLDPDDHS